MTASPAQVITHSLIKISDLTDIEINNILNAAITLEKSNWNAPIKAKLAETLSRKVIAEAFFEPSTRTRLSFQMASQRLGVNVIGCDFETSSSLVKGEAESDTLLNLAAMQPDLLVVRTKGGDDIVKALEQITVPILNAGFGQIEHPTQALLDLLTLVKRKGSVKGLKLLIVGDVAHSRVASSNIQIFKRLGALVGVCAPMFPQNLKQLGIEFFETLEAGAKWADVVMGLRVQVERFAQHEKAQFMQDDYIQKFRLDERNLNGLSKNSLIMHPGPFVPGVDFDPKLLKDTRCVIHEQVTNGGFIRGALILRSLGFMKEIM
jgi:aspartate carbamoyltransferase catalytic subunit